MSDVQCPQRRALSGTFIRQYGHSFSVGPAGSVGPCALAVSFTSHATALTIRRKMATAMSRNVITSAMNCPNLMPPHSQAGPPPLALPPVASLSSGMNRLSTNDVMSFPNAAPRTTAIASWIRFPLKAKSLNSLTFSLRKVVARLNMSGSEGLSWRGFLRNVEPRRVQLDRLGRRFLGGGDFSRALGVEVPAGGVDRPTPQERRPLRVGGLHLAVKRRRLVVRVHDPREHVRGVATRAGGLEPGDGELLRVRPIREQPLDGGGHRRGIRGADDQPRPPVLDHLRQRPRRRRHHRPRRRQRLQRRIR